MISKYGNYIPSVKMVIFFSKFESVTNLLLIPWVLGKLVNDDIHSKTGSCNIIVPKWSFLDGRTT